VRVLISIPYFSFSTNVRMYFQGLADAALGEGTGVKIHKLSVKEIKAVRVSTPFSRRYLEHKCCFFSSLA
jgi:hypothetical protein